MYSVSLRAVFILLSIAAAFLLEGIFLLDGGADALVTHATEKVFGDGKVLNTIYTGYPIIDHVLPMSVSFWDPVLSKERATILLSRTFSASVQSLGVFAMVESRRRGCKNIMLRWVPVNILAWQLIGAAIFVPLYLMLELEQHSFSSERPVSQDPTVPYLQAKALLPATIITVLHLYRMVYFPPSGITTAQHQAWTAVWQLTPFLCYAAMAAIGLFLTSRNTEQVVESERSSNSDVPWLKAVFLLFGFFSAVTHLSVLWELIVTNDHSISHESLFIPLSHKLGHSNATELSHIAESTFFLQWDYIIIIIAAAVYVTVILHRMYAGLTRLHQTGIFFMALFLNHAVSFGCVCAIILFLREDILRQKVAVSGSVSHQQKKLK
ncbi:hypothetical protein BS50DRAFT_508692 [Corynespora cassiicola Philippines]|uniref:Uncharacterized protein n=1 Tax=Corynespora cassiicola Philippines TaxID=1448308 RepID=A0A2T2N1Q7_CORCC|nr:hypothetical protein BS50DRAFT_508692 [Corynespora cassiicola Philippines]